MSDSPTFRNSLKFVRKQRKLSAASVAQALNTSVERIAAFESGAAVPSAAQYVKFQGIFGVPDYLLAGEDRPNLEPMLFDLRRPHGAEAAISPSGLKAYFASVAFTDTIAGLTDMIGVPPDDLELPRVSLAQLKRTIPALHEELDFDPTDSALITNPDGAFKKLRYKIERYGIYCLMTAVPPQDYRGLYTEPDASTRLIIVNKRTFSPKARLFTLLHEFAHALIGVTGISDPFILENQVERRCNEFASAFLAPTPFLLELFDKSGKKPRELSDKIRWVSNRCLLSLGATAYRLHLEGRISRPEYEGWRAQVGLLRDYGAEDLPADENDADGEASGGGNYAYNVIADRGHRPIEIVRRALAKNFIDVVDASQVLNARGPTLEQVFSTSTTRIAGYKR